MLVALMRTHGLKPTTHICVCYQIASIPLGPECFEAYHGKLLYVFLSSAST